MKLSPREFMTYGKSVRSSVGVHKYWWEYFLSETSRLYDDARVERSRPATHWHRAGAGHGAPRARQRCAPATRRASVQARAHRVRVSRRARAEPRQGQARASLRQRRHMQRGDTRRGVVRPPVLRPDRPRAHGARALGFRRVHRAHQPRAVESPRRARRRAGRVRRAHDGFRRARQAGVVQSRGADHDGREGCPRAHKPDVVRAPGHPVVLHARAVQRGFPQDGRVPAPRRQAEPWLRRRGRLALLAPRQTLLCQLRRCDPRP